MEVGKINHVTIEHTPTDKYFVVLNVEFEPQPRQNNGGCIGIDVGIKEFYTDSNGKSVANPKYLEKQCVNSFVNSVGCQENRKALVTAGNSVLRLPWSMKDYQPEK